MCDTVLSSENPSRGRTILKETDENLNILWGGPKKGEANSKRSLKVDLYYEYVHNNVLGEDSNPIAFGPTMDGVGGGSSWWSEQNLGNNLSTNVGFFVPIQEIQVRRRFENFSGPEDLL